MRLLKRPCKNCPFRRDDQAIDLMPGRLSGIVDDLLADDFSTFHCHKTTYSTGGYDGDGEEYVSSGKESVCAGAMGYLHKVGRPSVGMRLALFGGDLTMQELDLMATSVIDHIGE